MDDSKNIFWRENGDISLFKEDRNLKISNYKQKVMKIEREMLITQNIDLQKQINECRSKYNTIRETNAQLLKKLDVLNTDLVTDCNQY